MKKIMLIGKIGCGKTTFSQNIKKEERVYQKTQTISFCDETIDTPGEYLENRSYLKALIVTATQADAICFLHSAVDEDFCFPYGFATMFPIPVVGVVTKIDLDLVGAGRKKVKSAMQEVGIERIFFLNNFTRDGVAEIEAFIETV